MKKVSIGLFGIVLLLSLMALPLSGYVEKGNKLGDLAICRPGNPGRRQLSWRAGRPAFQIGARWTPRMSWWKFSPPAAPIAMPMRLT